MAKERGKCSIWGGNQDNNIQTPPKKKLQGLSLLLLLLLLSLTVALALLLGVGVVEEATAVVGPGHAAKLDPLQSVLQGLGPIHA